MVLSIETLSDDVLLEVFEYLDANSLKKAALVCKTWNDVISLSPSTMKKLRLKISNVSFSSQNLSWDEKVEEVLSLERKFQAIDITLFDLRTENAAKSFVEIIACHGSQIREMLIQDVNFDTFDDFSGILENLPLLEKLEINRLRFNKPGKPEEIKSIALKELNSLTVRNSSWAVFQHLIGSQITSLTVMRTIVIPVDREYLMNFLKTCQKLESIELDYPAFMKIFSEKLPENLKFKLKILKFLSVQIVDEVDNIFNEFLLSQSSTIEELLLNNLSLKIVKTILGKLTQLKKLRINSASIPSEKEFFDQFVPKKNLKEIEAHDEFLHEDSAKNLLGICPNLESFKAIHDQSGIVSNCLPFMALHNTKLKALTIDSMKTQEEASVKFKCLESLSLESVEENETILAFLKENPSIQVFSVGNASQEKATDEFLETLMTETKLKSLKFAGDYETIEGIYNKIKVDYKNLKSLELTEIVGDKKGKTLVFNFPSDPKLWNGKCDFFD